MPRTREMMPHERVLLWVYRRSSGAPNLIAKFFTSAKLISVPERFETGATSHAHASSAVGAVDPVVKVESALLPSPARAHTHLPDALASFVAAFPPAASTIYFYSSRVSVGRVSLPPSKTKLPLQRRRGARRWRWRRDSGAMRSSFALSQPPPPRRGGRVKRRLGLGLRRGRKPEQNTEQNSGTESEVRTEIILAARQHERAARR